MWCSRRRSIRALRRRYPDADSTYLVEPAAAPVVRRQSRTSTTSSSSRTAAAGARLRRRLATGAAPARAAVRRRDRSARRAAQRLAHLGSAARRVRVGYDVAGRSWMYTRVVHRPRELRPRHSVENQWDLLAAVDAAFAAPADRDRDRVEMPVDPAARARDRRAAAPRRRGGRCAVIIVLHVSAGNPFRRWPEASFAELAAGLVAAAADRWVLVTGGPSDREAAARVIAAARDAAGAGGRAHRRRGEDLSLAELRALMDRAALFIGGDSGPLHIAATSRRADRRPLRPDAAGAIGAVAAAAPAGRHRSTPARCPAGRAISACACRATSVPDGHLGRDGVERPPNALLRGRDDADVHRRASPRIASSASAVLAADRQPRHGAVQPARRRRCSSALAALLWLCVIALRRARGRTCRRSSGRSPSTRALTLVSAAVSRAIRARASSTAEQLVLFLMVPDRRAPRARRPRAMTMLDVIIALGAAGALVGIVQYAMLRLRQPRAPAAWVR